MKALRGPLGIRPTAHDQSSPSYHSPLRHFGFVGFHVGQELASRTPNPNEQETERSSAFFHRPGQTSSHGFPISQPCRRLDPKASAPVTPPPISLLLDLQVRVPWLLAAASWCHRGRLRGEAPLHGLQGGGVLGTPALIFYSAGPCSPPYLSLNMGCGIRGNSQLSSLSQPQTLCLIK